MSTTLTYLMCVSGSNHIIKIYSWRYRRKFNNNCYCEGLYSKSQYWKMVRRQGAKKMIDYNPEF